MRRCKIVFIVFYFVLFYLGRKIEQENVVGLQCREIKPLHVQGLAQHLAYTRRFIYLFTNVLPVPTLMLNTVLGT